MNQQVHFVNQPGMTNVLKTQFNIKKEKRATMEPEKNSNYNTNVKKLRV